MTGKTVHSATASRRPGSAAVLIALILVLAGLAQTHPGRTIIDRLGISASAQPYTELYLADDAAITALTEQPHHGRLSVPIAFVIADQQQRSVRYAWTVTVFGRTAAQGAQDLGQGQKVTIRRRVTMRCPARPGAGATAGASAPRSPLIVVSLASQHESIDVHVNCHA